MAGSFHIGTQEISAGTIEPGLYLVATPIGNLRDVTIRALETIAAADIVACEDTRVTRKLLDRYAISVRPLAYHEHNAAKAGPALIAALEEGKSVALVSDAGTPLVSDPGYRLVEQAIEAGIRVTPVPGASAPLAALVASGMPTDAFLFAGFLPNRKKARIDRLNELKSVPGTLVFFESPKRLSASLADCAESLGGDRPAAVCRELTKTYEEVRRGGLEELARRYAAADNVRGEIVLVIGPPEAREMEEVDVDGLLRELGETLAPGKAATEAAKVTGLSRKLLYKRLLAMKDVGA
ncbi:MAG: ribosomal RNA small subunit methyltransferase I [Rhizobiaceae bacterium MnEN-MB40S]|nr:MAG: ribosomal RNA small subunit methyltransferase I [Rhizobiaceae bacterium MnEN-MB40S]